MPKLLGASLRCLSLLLLAPVHAQPVVGECPMFPVEAVFNQVISDPVNFPAHARSRDWIEAIGANRRLHADFGRSEDAERHRDYYGIPFNAGRLASSAVDWPVVSYGIRDQRDGNGMGVPAESDCAVLQDGDVHLHRGCDAVAPEQRRFPFKDAWKVEGGHCNDPKQCGDRHVLVIEAGRCRLWESFFTYKVDGTWSSYATAAWDLRSLALRPDGWTSGDAAGLPILPLLARAQEASAGEVRHALRVTFRDAVLERRHVWPARHSAGKPSPGGIPFGALMRLRQGFEAPAHWTPQARALLRAMQDYGLYVADIGSDFYVQGEPSNQWSEQTIRQIQSLTLRDFEFVDLGSVMRHPKFDNNSLRAAW